MFGISLSQWRQSVGCFNLIKIKNLNSATPNLSSPFISTRIENSNILMTFALTLKIILGLIQLFSFSLFINISFVVFFVFYVFLVFSLTPRYYCTYQGFHGGFVFALFNAPRCPLMIKRFLIAAIEVICTSNQRLLLHAEPILTYSKLNLCIYFRTVIHNIFFYVFVIQLLLFISGSVELNPVKPVFFEKI